MMDKARIIIVTCFTLISSYSSAYLTSPQKSSMDDSGIGMGTVSVLGIVITVLVVWYIYAINKKK